VYSLGGLIRISIKQEASCFIIVVQYIIAALSLKIDDEEKPQRRAAGFSLASGVWPRPSRGLGLGKLTTAQFSPPTLACESQGGMCGDRSGPTGGSNAGVSCFCGGPASELSCGGMGPSKQVSVNIVFDVLHRTDRGMECICLCFIRFYIDRTFNGLDWPAERDRLLQKVETKSIREPDAVASVSPMTCCALSQSISDLEKFPCFYSC
jgi:hypothetical protein